MRVALDLHQAVDADRARPGHAADIIPAEVDQHHVLRTLLEVAQQLLLELPVFHRISAPPPRPRKRPGLDVVSLDLDELLRRRADDVAVATQGDEEHVGRRIDGAKAPVDVEWSGRQLLSKSLGDDDLERIAGVDVFAGRVDHRAELPRAHVRLPAGPVLAMRGSRWRIRREPRLHLIEARCRVFIRLALRPVDGQEHQPARDVVKDRQVLGAQEGSLGHGRRRSGRERKAFEVARGLVAEIADRPAMKSRDAADGRGGLARDRPQRAERVARVKLQRPWLVADERIARQALAALDALEQEAGCVGRAKQGIRPDRGQHVSQDLAIDRDQRVVLGEDPGFIPGGCA